MEALFALLPVIKLALAGSTALEATLAGLSLGQWVTIAGTLWDAEPKVLDAIKALHPALQVLSDDVAIFGPEKAASRAWQSRQPKTIPGYGPDGGPADIPNPDVQVEK